MYICEFHSNKEQEIYRIIHIYIPITVLCNRIYQKKIYIFIIINETIELVTS